MLLCAESNIIEITVAAESPAGGTEESGGGRASFERGTEGVAARSGAETTQVGPGSGQPQLPQRAAHQKSHGTARRTGLAAGEATS